MKNKIQSILKITVKVLKAILYFLSAGHLCSCKCHENDTASKEEISK